jgi:hypothetical protein
MSPVECRRRTAGIQYNYFGHDEWKQFAPGLDSLDDADKIRGKVLLAFEQAERIAASGNADQAQIQELLTFVLVGAGTVGVEMAGTLAEMARMVLVRDFRHIDPRSAQIFLYEAGPRILPSYPEDLSSKARRHLVAIGRDHLYGDFGRKRVCGGHHGRWKTRSEPDGNLERRCLGLSRGSLARDAGGQSRQSQGEPGSFDSRLSKHLCHWGYGSRDRSFTESNQS